MKENKKLLDLMYEIIHLGQTRMNKKVAYEKLEREAQIASFTYHRNVEKTLFISREIFQTIGTYIDIPNRKDAMGGIIHSGFFSWNTVIVCVLFQKLSEEKTKIEIISFVKQGFGRKHAALKALKRYEELIIKI